MKKILALVAGSLLCAASLFGQVLGSNGIQNTLSTSFGHPYGYIDDNHRPNVRYYGLLDTLQARIDIAQFTVEGMLNWGALTDWDGNNFSSFYFANTEITPFYYSNHFDQGGWWTNGNAESYYVNFLFHPTKNFDLGMGTRLNWKIGPAPSSLGNYWEPLAHVVQGGLKDGVPGSADVVGYTYYANMYTALYENCTKAALGARYKYKDVIEAGIAIPSGVTTNAPLFNAAVKVHPIDLLTASVAYEGILQSKGNFYAGVSLYLSKITIDTYLGLNFRPQQFGGYSEQHWGTGAAVTFDISKIHLVLRPEIGFTFYNYNDYTPAWYSGLRLDYAINQQLAVGGWASLGFGSSNKKWSDKYTGGYIIDIRPDFSWKINKNNTLSLFIDYQNRKRYDQYIYDVWASGVYWTYKK